GTAPTEAAAKKGDEAIAPTTSEARTIVLVGGAALTVGALALATVYSLRVRSDNSNIDDARAKLTNKTSDCAPGQMPPPPCTAIAQSNARLPTDRSVRDG